MRKDGEFYRVLRRGNSAKDGINYFFGVLIRTQWSLVSWRFRLSPTNDEQRRFLCFVQRIFTSLDTHGTVVIDILAVL